MYVLGEGHPSMHREMLSPAFRHNPETISIKTLWIFYKLLGSIDGVPWYMTQCHIVNSKHIC